MKTMPSLPRLFVLVIMLAACSGPAPDIPTSQPAMTDTPPPTATHTQTPSPTSAPTETPTATPTATLTPFPTLTPLPPGYYANYDAGFSFQHPTSWRKGDENSISTTFIDQSLGLFTAVFGYPVVIDPATGFETENIGSATEILSAVLFPNVPVTIGETYFVQIGDNIEAPAKEVKAIVDSQDMSARIIFYTQNSRSYVFAIVAQTDSLSLAESRIDNLLNSVELFSPQPFGLPKEHNLIQSGYDPKPKDLDPARTTSSASDYVGLLFTGLVRLNPDLEVETDLAESYSTNDDGTVYTFVLRPGLKFADGTPLTSEDVIYSWERAADPETGSPTARTYLGDILGFQDKLDGRADTIEGLQAVDERTLVVTLEEPRPYFLAKLTYATSFVVDQDQVEGAEEDWVFEANSSGPYVLKEYRETEAIVFERNPEYHTPTSIQYVTHLIDPGGSWISRYEDGTLDILYLDVETTERVRREDDPLHDQWQSGPSMCTTFVGMNNILPPFDDPLVRKAFALAVNREILNARLANNLNIMGHTLLPPGMPGYSENLRMIYDPASAKQALDESSYAGNLPEVRMEAAGFATDDSPMISALVEMWQQTLNVPVKVIYLDPENYMSEALKEENHMTIRGWCADYPDPQNFLDVLYRTGSELNISGYSNLEYDELIDQANIELDPEKRIDLYQQAEKLLLEDFAVAPISHGVMDVLVRPRVQGYVIAPIVDTYLPWLSLEPENP